MDSTRNVGALVVVGRILLLAAVLFLLGGRLTDWIASAYRPFGQTREQGKDLEIAPLVDSGDEDGSRIARSVEVTVLPASVRDPKTTGGNLAQSTYRTLPLPEREDGQPANLTTPEIRVLEPQPGAGLASEDEPVKAGF